MSRRRLPRIAPSALLVPWLCLAPVPAVEPERPPSRHSEAASPAAEAPGEEGAAPRVEPRVPAAGKPDKEAKAGEKPKKKREAGGSRLSLWINPLTVVLAALAVVAVIGAGIDEATEDDGDASPSRP